MSGRSRPVMLKSSLLLPLAIFLLCVSSSCTSTEQLRNQEIDYALKLSTEHAEKQDYGRAIEILEAALRKLHFEQKLQYNLGYLYMQNKDYQKATTSFALLVDEYPKHIGYRMAYAGALSLGGAVDQAITQWKTVLEIDAYHETAAMLLLQNLIQEQRFEEGYELASDLYDKQMFSKELFHMMAEAERGTGRGDGTSYDAIASAYE